MSGSLAKYSICLFALTLLMGCTTIAPHEKRIEENMAQGKAVVIIYGMKDAWVNKDNSNQEIWPNNGFSVVYLDPGVYVYLKADFTEKLQHETYKTIPKILSSPMGRVVRTNTTVQEQRSRVESVWHNADGYVQNIMNAYGQKIGEQWVQTSPAGYRDVTRYYNVNVPAIRTTIIPKHLNERELANFASFEVKAGEIIMLDFYSISDIDWDIKSCAALEGSENASFSCPITSLDVLYIPASQLTGSFEWMKKNLSDQQIERVIRRPINLGKLMPANATKKNKHGNDVYTIKKL